MNPERFYGKADHERTNLESPNGDAGTPRKKEAGRELSDWVNNGAVGQAPETTTPRKKEAGQDRFTEMTLEDVAEMLAAHSGHYAYGGATDCACWEVTERAMIVILLRAQALAEKHGPTGGRFFRGLLRRAIEEL